MEREIKFRAKSKTTNKFVYGIPIKTHIGTYMVYEENPHVCSIYGYMEIDGFELIDENTIGRLVGLKDKNGKEIFDGDFVKTKCGRIRQVVWANSPSHIGFDLKPIETKHPYAPEYNLYKGDNLEVIGNMYDNSEILNK